MTAAACPLCGRSRCAKAELAKLLVPELEWLWIAIADAADRRGDPEMVSGPAVTVAAPLEASRRAAVAGLVTGTPRPGSAVRIRLDFLTGQLRGGTGDLTPGAVAAHAAGRALGTRVAQARERRATTERVTGIVAAVCRNTPGLDELTPDILDYLRRTGWITRLANQGDPELLIAEAMDVTVAVMQLPVGERVDRRMLMPHRPHALDEGTTLAGLVLAILVAAGRISADRRLPPKGLWAQAGVDCDQIVGGLSTLGIVPQGWTLPATAVCTLPPRELIAATWPRPEPGGQWVFVTENPSILAAAADRAAAKNIAIRLVCTLGNPSQLEINALSRMAETGWRIAVRADFDPAGIRTVGAILDNIPTATAWRMGCDDYQGSNPTLHIGSEPIPATPWDPCLAGRIAQTGRLAFEEAITELLVHDLERGIPAAARCS